MSASPQEVVYTTNQTDDNFNVGDGAGSFQVDSVITGHSHFVTNCLYFVKSVYLN